MGCLGLIEPIKEEKVAKKGKKDIQEEIEEEESLKDLECIPSCLLSDISSSVSSPKE